MNHSVLYLPSKLFEYIIFYILFYLGKSKVPTPNSSSFGESRNHPFYLEHNDIKYQEFKFCIHTLDCKYHRNVEIIDTVCIQYQISNMNCLFFAFLVYQVPFWGIKSPFLFSFNSNSIIVSLHV